jgi:predicted nucleic acid-binding protein
VFIAVLDTSVLWPGTLRDFLLSLAVEGLYRPVWSSAVLDELRFHESLKLQRRGITESEAGARADRLVSHMRNAFADAEITGWEQLVGSYRLPDPDDEHLVAAAVIGGAGAIITYHTADLPADRLPRGIEVLDPSQFTRNTVELDPGAALRAVRQIVARSGQRGPGWSVPDVLDLLAHRYRLRETATFSKPSCSLPTRRGKTPSTS